MKKSLRIALIIEEKTSMNEAMLIGEFKPVCKNRVIGGVDKFRGTIKVHLNKTKGDTFLSQSRTQDLANRAAFWLTMVAILAGSIALMNGS